MTLRSPAPMRQLGRAIGPQSINGTLTAAQAAWRSQWARIPDHFPMDTRMHTVHVTPVNGSTVTFVNPLDPGTVDDLAHPCHFERPGGYGALYTNR